MRWTYVEAVILTGKEALDTLYTSQMEKVRPGCLLDRSRQRAFDILLGFL